jgi:hypothetical protein
MHVRLSICLVVLPTLACGAPLPGAADGGTVVSGGTHDPGATEASDADDDMGDGSDGTDTGGNASAETGADATFDVGAGPSDDGGASDGGGEGSCGMRECVDTTANAAVLLEPCSEHFADFYAPYDEDYECWSGAPDGSLIGDTDATFAYDDPDLLLVGQWHGGIAQVRVTRDAHCNITGFVDASWESYTETEPDDVFVRGMTWLDDGTMFLARSVPGQPQRVGQRAPGTTVTSNLVDTLSLLPPWEQSTIGQGKFIVALTVVPPGFPGAGTLKMLAERPDTSHWFTMPLVANGNGTYDLGAAIEETEIHPPEDDWGGYYARGMAFIGADNPQIDVPSVLIPEAWNYTVALYELDAEGNPLPETRTPFVDGLGMPSGAEADAVSGNNFVFTGRRSQDVYVVRGCEHAPPGEPPS